MKTQHTTPTGSTSSESSVMEVQRPGVGKVPAHLMANRCSGSTIMCCFDGGVSWGKEGSFNLAGAGSCWPHHVGMGAPSWTAQHSPISEHRRSFASRRTVQGVRSGIGAATCFAKHGLQDRGQALLRLDVATCFAGMTGARAGPRPLRGRARHCVPARRRLRSPRRAPAGGGAGGARECPGGAG